MILNLGEQGLGSKIQAAGLSGNKSGRDQRQKERKEKRSRIDDEKARGRVISYNEDFVNKINKFVRLLEKDGDIADNFGVYIESLRKLANDYKDGEKTKLENMELGKKE